MGRSHQSMKILASKSFLGTNPAPRRSAPHHSAIHIINNHFPRLASKLLAFSLQVKYLGVWNEKNFHREENSNSWEHEENLKIREGRWRRNANICSYLNIHSTWGNTSSQFGFIRNIFSLPITQRKNIKQTFQLQSCLQRVKERFQLFKATSESTS